MSSNEMDERLQALLNKGFATPPQTKPVPQPVQASTVTSPPVQASPFVPPPSTQAHVTQTPPVQPVAPPPSQPVSTPVTEQRTQPVVQPTPPKAKVQPVSTKKKPIDVYEGGLSYMEYERLHGVGLGVGGLGSLVHLNEDKEYVPRKKKEHIRTPMRLDDGSENPLYEADKHGVDDTISVRVPAALYYALADMYEQEIGSRVPKIDMMTFVLLSHVRNKRHQQALLEGLSKRFDTLPLLWKTLENHQLTQNVNPTYAQDSEAIYDLSRMVSSLQGQMDSMRQQQSKVAERQLMNLAHVQGLERLLSVYLLTYYSIQPKMPTSMDELMGLMVSDGAMQLSHATYNTGIEAAKQYETMQQTQRRRKA